MTAIAVTISLSGVVIFLISLPLVYRKIPMNQLYGIRIPATFESEQRWYDINSYGGRQLARWSWLIIAMGILGFFVPAEVRLVYAQISLAVSVIAIVIPIFLILRWSRRRSI